MGGSAGELPTPQMLEELGRRVRGVYSCRVIWPNGAPLPQRVRVVVAGYRRTAVARDLQSAFFAASGLLIPLDRFVVTPIRSPDELGRPLRLALAAIAMERRGADVQVRVTLEEAGDSYSGQAEGPAAAVPRLAAAATLAALQSAAPHVADVELLEVIEVAVAGRPVMLVALGASERLLLGTAAVHRSAAEAVCRAVLDALNRWLEEPPAFFTSLHGGPP